MQFRRETTGRKRYSKCVCILCINVYICMYVCVWYISIVYVHCTEEQLYYLHVYIYVYISTYIYIHTSRHHIYLLFSGGFIVKRVQQELGREHVFERRAAETAAAIRRGELLYWMYSGKCMYVCVYVYIHRFCLYVCFRQVCIRT